jgi:ribosomal protein S18 acetylase RimI-like enzyme
MTDAAGDILIRPYRDDDEAEWLRVHAVIMTISHAWNYCIQERPAYEGYASTRLVAEQNGHIVGLTDTQYENEPGELCFLKDSVGGYVLEFGRLPEAAGCRLGERMIQATADDALEHGVHRLEYWSQDRAAQRYYRRLGMKEIGRHFRFRLKPPAITEVALASMKIGVEYVYGVCAPEDWPRIQADAEILTQHPLEPHLCVGFEIRF